MAKPLKTQPTKASVNDHIANLDDEQQRNDCTVLQTLFHKITKTKAMLWGESIIGYGQYHYQTPSGQKGDWPLTAFAARKAGLSVYIMTGFTEFSEPLAKLGKYKAGRSCLTIKRLADIDLEVLAEIVERSVTMMHERYETSL